MPDALRPARSSAGDEILQRLGTDREPVEKLARKAAAGGSARIGIHGVSVSPAEPAPDEPVSTARRSEVAKHFPVHDTPTIGDPLHRTVELPKPVTAEVADLFNRLFGRG